MMPIVDGLEAQYGDDIAFIRLNARDNDVGQRSFEISGLPGHPGYLLMMPDGTEAWRGFGQQSADQLGTVFQAALNGE